MRKSRLLLCALAFASVASSGISHADACGTAKKDPFGSCESGRDTAYATHCATQQAIPSVGAVTPITTATPSPAVNSPPANDPTVNYSNGVEGCVDGAAIPAGGRAGGMVVVKSEQDPNGTNYTVYVSVFEDGNETKDPSITGAWNRADAQTTIKSTNPGDAAGSTFVCAKRGETGTWDTGAPNTLDKGASGNGVNDGC